MAPARQGSNSGVTSEARNEVMRMLAAAGVAGDISDADKAYIASTVSRETGIDETAAKQRVDQFIKARTEAIEKARTFADKARKMGVILAFITAVSLLLAAAGGWWAATMGGAHRDEETVIPLLLWRK